MNRFLSLALLVYAMFVLAGCQSSTVPVEAGSPQPTKTVPASSAPTAAGTEASGSDSFVASGPITVENQLDVAAQREGVIAALLVDAGKSVRKGQLLARLDNRQITADLEAAKAQADSIEADLKNWEATVKMAGTDLDRSEKMYASKLITQSQLDHDRFKLTATKYEYDREQKNLQRAKSVVNSLELELEKTLIVAPFTGVVARRYVRDGEHVTNGERLFWVTATSPMRVKFTLPEKYASSIRNGDKLQLVPVEAPEGKYAAKIVMVSPVVDPASGSIDVTAELTGSTGSLRPGMITNIRLDTVR